MPRHGSSAVPLAWLYTGLIVYASLYPFSGWRPPGSSPLAFLMQPWWPWWTWFDLIANLLGYLPFGVQVLGRVRDRLAQLLEGTAAEAWTELWSSGGPLMPLLPAGELALVVMGLLAPCLVALTIAAPGWRRVLLVLGAVAIGCVTMTLS